jgi:hypothetical protein
MLADLMVWSSTSSRETSDLPIILTSKSRVSGLADAAGSPGTQGALARCSAAA